MDNLRCLLSIRRMDRVLKAWIRELCRVKKGLDKRIDVSVLHFLAHVERIAKRVYVGECAGSHSMGRLQKRWIDTLKDCSKKRGLDVWQAKRMVQVRSEWRGHSMGDEPQTLMRCHICRLSQLYEICGWKFVCG